MRPKDILELALPVLAFCLCAGATASVVEPINEDSSAQHSSPKLDQIPDRGASLYYRAVTRLREGGEREAMELLAQCLDLHEGFDPSANPVFAPLLRDSADWTRRIAELQREFPSVSKARLAFVTRERDLVPEGMAYDPRQDVFYLSSLNRRKIVRMSADGRDSDFAPGGRYGLLPILGIRTDPSDGTVWAASWSEDTDRSELLHFDATGGLLSRHAAQDAGRHGFNDLVVRRDGAIYLTDSLSDQVYRFDRRSRAFEQMKFSRALHEPNGIALSDDDSVVFVGDDFGVQQLNFRTGDSSEVDPGPHNTLAGADGLYWHRGSLVAIQNAIGAPRIASFKLSKDGMRVIQTTVLEYRSRFLSGWPTTGAIKGDDLYFIVNSQGENMRGDQVVDAAKLEPVRIGRIALP